MRFPAQGWQSILFKGPGHTYAHTKGSNQFQFPRCSFEWLGWQGWDGEPGTHTHLDRQSSVLAVWVMGHIRFNLYATRKKRTRERLKTQTLTKHLWREIDANVSLTQGFFLCEQALCLFIQYVNINAQFCKYHCDMFISVCVYVAQCISALAAGSAPWEDYWF